MHDLTDGRLGQRRLLRCGCLRKTTTANNVAEDLERLKLHWQILSSHSLISREITINSANSRNPANRCQDLRDRFSNFLALCKRGFSRPRFLRGLEGSRGSDPSSSPRNSRSIPIGPQRFEKPKSLGQRRPDACRKLLFPNNENLFCCNAGKSTYKQIITSKVGLGERCCWLSAYHRLNSQHPRNVFSPTPRLPALSQKKVRGCSHRIGDVEVLDVLGRLRAAFLAPPNHPCFCLKGVRPPKLWMFLDCRPFLSFISCCSESFRILADTFIGGLV